MQGLTGGQQPLMGLATRAAAAAVDAEMWQAWLADLDTRRRFETLMYRRGHDHCAFWLGAISSTGHGKFRAGSRARGPGGSRARHTEPDRVRARLRLPAAPRHHRDGTR